MKLSHDVNRNTEKTHRQITSFLLYDIMGAFHCRRQLIEVLENPPSYYSRSASMHFLLSSYITNIFSILLNTTFRKPIAMIAISRVIDKDLLLNKVYESSYIDKFKQICWMII